MSNFLIHHLDELKDHGGIVPHVNQVEHNYFKEHSLLLIIYSLASILLAYWLLISNYKAQYNVLFRMTIF